MYMYVIEHIPIRRERDILFVCPCVFVSLSRSLSLSLSRIFLCAQRGPCSLIECVLLWNVFSCRTCSLVERVLLHIRMCPAWIYYSIWS